MTGVLDALIAVRVHSKFAGAGARVRVAHRLRGLWSDAQATVRIIDSAHEFSEIPGVSFEGGVVRFTLRRPSIALVVFKQ